MICRHLLRDQSLMYNSLAVTVSHLQTEFSSYHSIKGDLGKFNINQSVDASPK
jgi:hypothetical protein